MLKVNNQQLQAPLIHSGSTVAVASKRDRSCFADQPIVAVNCICLKESVIKECPNCPECSQQFKSHRSVITRTFWTALVILSTNHIATRSLYNICCCEWKVGCAVVIKISIEMGESTVSKNLIDPTTGFNTELINKEDGTTSYLRNAQEQHKNRVIKCRTGFKKIFFVNCQLATRSYHYHSNSAIGCKISFLKGDSCREYQLLLLLHE